MARQGRERKGDPTDVPPEPATETAPHHETHPASARTPWLPVEGADRAYARFPKDRRVVTDDGTTIAYTVLRPEPSQPAALPVVFANGWSCPDGYWADIAPRLREAAHPCVLSDTRGHGASGLPVTPVRGARNLTADDLSIPRFARDLCTVLDDAGIERAVFMGHSMGVQTALEAYRLAPERVAALVLVAGPYENPLKTFYGLPLADLLFPVVRQVFRTVPEVVAPIWATIGPARIGHLGARLLRAAGPKSTAQGLHPYLLHLAASDPAVLMATADAMRRQSAADILADIAAPTLVLGAGHDVFTPVANSEQLAATVPGAELVLFPDAGHTLPIEEPQAIADATISFLTRRVERAPSADAAT